MAQLLKAPASSSCAGAFRLGRLCLQIAADLFKLICPNGNTAIQQRRNFPVLLSVDVC
jgi:hypothetical protein